MRDKWLQQPPVNALPVNRRDRIAGDWPVQEAMALTLERDLYGYPRAARALRELARSVAGPAQPPGSLGEPPPQQAPVTHSANEYFGHLPDTSWHLRVTYHRV